MKVISLAKSGWFLSSNSYLVKNKEKGIIIDTSFNNKKDEILENLKKNIDLDKVSLIILSHTHYDHTGCVKFLKKYLKNAKVVVHESEAHLLEKGKCEIPKGNTISSSVVSYFGSKLNEYTSFATYEPITPDIKVRKSYKIKGFGEVLHTPGHSKGSMSVVIGDMAFVGDMMNYNWNKVYNPLADNEDLNIFQWKRLLDMGIKTFYPGHGTRISRGVVDEVYKRTQIK